jgi:hypothetical protein
VASAENEFQAASIKLHGKLSKERNALLAKVQQFKALVANAESAVARLKTKKSKPLIKASFAKKPLVEEIQRIESTLESNRQQEIKIQAEMTRQPTRAAPPPPPPVEENICQQCNEEMMYVEHEYYCSTCPTADEPETAPEPPIEPPKTTRNMNWCKEGYSTPFCVPGCPLDTTYCAAHTAPDLVEHEREIEQLRQAQNLPPMDMRWRRKE